MVRKFGLQLTLELCSWPCAFVLVLGCGRFIIGGTEWRWLIGRLLVEFKVASVLSAEADAAPAAQHGCPPRLTATLAAGRERQGWRHKLERTAAITQLTLAKPALARPDSITATVATGRWRGVWFD